MNEKSNVIIEDMNVIDSSNGKFLKSSLSDFFPVSEKEAESHHTRNAENALS